MNEIDIIQEILDGKTERYSYFLDKYGQQIFRLIVGIVSNPEEAEELTQDVFLKAFQHLSSFRAKSSFSTWIYKIATNAAIANVRKKRHHLFHYDETTLKNLSDEQVDQALNDTSEEQLKKLSQAIELLKADEHALITLYYTENKTLKEIASILGIKENHIKIKLYRIRKKLYFLIKNKK